MQIKSSLSKVETVALIVELVQYRFSIF